MKKIIAFLTVLCIIFCFCSCGNNNSNAAAENSIKIIENEKCKTIVESLGTMKIGEVLEDIKNIDLYLEPDFNEEKDTVKTYENTGSDGEKEFAIRTKTASELEADVRFYIDSGDNRTVSIKTQKYSIFANTLNSEDVYGLGDTNIILVSESENTLFECSAEYYYDNGTVVFCNAVYLENGSCQRYSYGVDPEGIESEYTDILVDGKAPKISDEITSVLLTDKSFDYAAINIDNGTKWYCADEKWYVEAELAIAVDSEKQAKDFIEKNNIKGTVEDYGSIIIKIDSAVLQIDKNAFLEDGKLPEFIIGETENSFFGKITLDSSGVITGLTPSHLAVY